MLLLMEIIYIGARIMRVRRLISVDLESGFQINMG